MLCELLYPRSSQGENRPRLPLAGIRSQVALVYNKFPSLADRTSVTIDRLQNLNVNVAFLFKPYYNIAANTRDVLTLDTQNYLGQGLD